MINTIYISLSHLLRVLILYDPDDPAGWLDVDALRLHPRQPPDAHVLDLHRHDVAPRRQFAQFRLVVQTADDYPGRRPPPPPPPGGGSRNFIDTLRRGASSAIILPSWPPPTHPTRSVDGDVGICLGMLLMVLCVLLFRVCRCQ